MLLLLLCVHFGPFLWCLVLWSHAMKGNTTNCDLHYGVTVSKWCKINSQEFVLLLFFEWWYTVSCHNHVSEWKEQKTTPTVYFDTCGSVALWLVKHYFHCLAFKRNEDEKKLEGLPHSQPFSDDKEKLSLLACLHRKRSHGKQVWDVRPAAPEHLFPVVSVSPPVFLPDRGRENSPKQRFCNSAHCSKSGVFLC